MEEESFDVKQLLQNGYEIDPKTHPIFLREYEWALFEKMQTVRPPLFHRHDWVYRLHRALGDVYIVSNTEMIATHISPGRYCPSCKKVEFLPSDKVEPHTDGGWTQLDMIALGLQ